MSYLDNNGVLYLWNKIKATFAAKTHGHAPSDLSAAVPVSKGGTGATTAANALTNLGLTATAAELNYMDGVTSGVQTQLNAKAASGHTHAGSSLTSAVPVNKGGTGATSAAAALTNLGLTATAAELNFMDGVTSNVQTQLGGKAASGHTHAGDSLTSAVPVNKGGTGAANIDDARETLEAAHMRFVDDSQLSFDANGMLYTEYVPPVGGNGTTCAIAPGSFIAKRISDDNVRLYYWDGSTFEATVGSVTKTYYNLIDISLPSLVTSSADGLMRKADKAKLDAFGAASTYALKSEITSMYKHKGSVAALANLPASGNTAGDVYNLTSTGMNYVWTGSAWDALGQVFSITSITNAEIDAICV